MIKLSHILLGKKRLIDFIVRFLFLLIAVINSAALAAEAATLNDNFNCGSLSVVCPGAIANCQNAFSFVKNKKALTYTLQYLLSNHANNGGLKDASCAMQSKSFHSGVLSSALVKKGIQSGRFVLNDMDTNVAGTKSRGYYVDLCKGEFNEFKTNKGTGTTRKGHGFVDREGANTTIAGAFMTDTNSYHFTPFVCAKHGGKSKAKCARYRAYIAPLGNKSAVKLLGLNSSNNSSDFLKPMHTTPYATSIGCPSVNKEDGGASIIGKLTADGKTSLLINYHEGAMQDPTSHDCHNSDGSHQIKNHNKTGSQ